MIEQAKLIRHWPKWTVISNLKRRETTIWIGMSVELFDDEKEAEKCYQRHRQSGDTATKRPFHSSDEQYMYVMAMDSRKQE